MSMSIAGDVSDDTREVFGTTYGPIVVATIQQTENEIMRLDDLVNSLRDSNALATNSEQLAVRLHHVTLPKLDAIGAIEYEPGNHIIESGESDLIESVLGRL